MNWLQVVSKAFMAGSTIVQIGMVLFAIKRENRMFAKRAFIKEWHNYFEENVAHRWIFGDGRGI